MAEPAAVSALAGHLAPGRHGGTGGAPGLGLREIVPTAMVQVVGAGDAGSLAASPGGLGLAAAPRALRCSRGEDVRVRWNGPGQFLAVSTARTPGDLCAAIGAALAADGGAAVDVSHARTALRVEGPACLELLAKGCPLDLEAMEDDACAPTVVGHFNVLVHRESEAAFELYVTRSFAVAFLEWLLRAGEEFGVQVS